MINFKQILKESGAESGLELSADGEGPSEIDGLPPIPSDESDIHASPVGNAPASHEELIGVDPRLLSLHIDEGMGLISEIKERTSALPVFVNFPERSLILFFPSSHREETFSFDEAKDLLMSIEGFEAKTPTKEKKQPIEPKVEEDEENPMAPVPDENDMAFQNAMDKVNALVQTPDEKLTSISDETGVDLLGAKKQAIGIIQKKTSDDLNSLKAAAAKANQPSPTASSSGTSSSSGSTANMTI